MDLAGEGMGKLRGGRVDAISGPNATSGCEFETAGAGDLEGFGSTDAKHRARPGLHFDAAISRSGSEIGARDFVIGRIGSFGR